MATGQASPSQLPRVAIRYCTQCRWMLRAAWVGQELLTTFSTAIGEIALIPATGGLFSVTLTYEAVSETGEGKDVKEVLLWDRKTEGGFPEAKVLKQKLRDHIEPERDLGHSDKKGHVSSSKDDQSDQQTTAESTIAPTEKKAQSTQDSSVVCEDCT